MNETSFQADGGIPRPISSSSWLFFTASTAVLRFATSGDVMPRRFLKSSTVGLTDRIKTKKVDVQSIDRLLWRHYHDVIDMTSVKASADGALELVMSYM